MIFDNRKLLAASYWLLAKAEYYMLTTWAATLCRPDSKNEK